jgi:hypothetical protein
MKRGAKVKSPGRNRADARKARETSLSLPEAILCNDIHDVLQR